MFRKKLVNMCAATLAMVMAFAPAVTVCAGDYPEKSAAWTDTPGDFIEHTGDVINDGNQMSTVYAEGEGATVIQHGDATNVNDNWRGAAAHTGGTIYVEGNVEGGYGAGSYKNSTAVIDGNVTGRASDGVRVESESYMGVDGNIKAADDGIQTDGSANVIVEGNVTAGNTGISINIKEEQPKTVVSHTCGCGENCPAGERCTCSDRVDVVENERLIVVDGTVKAGSTGITVQLGKKTDEEGNVVGLSADNIPTIVVYELDAPELISAKTTDGSEEAVEEYLKNNIEYIVKKDAASSKYFDITDMGGLKNRSIETIAKINSDGSATTENLDLITLTLQKAFTVAVKEGYELTAGSNVTMEDLGNGSYRITLINNKGGITLSARLIKIVNPSAPAASNDVQVVYPEYAESSDNSNSQAEDGVFIFATFTVTGSSSLPEVLGASREGGANEEVVDYASRPVVKIAGGPLSAIQYKNTFINTMKNAPKNAIVRLETSIPSCFDKMMMEAYAERPDVILEVVFPVKGEKVKTVIPAGYDVMSLINEDGYCGFLNLLAVFGNSAE